MFTVENFINGLRKSSSNITIEEKDDKFLMFHVYRSIEEVRILAKERRVLIGEISISELRSIADELSHSYSMKKFMLCGNTSFETAIKEQNPMRPLFRNDDELFKTAGQGVDFAISRLSNTYFFALLCYFGAHPKADIDFRMSAFRLRQSDKITTINELIEFFRIFTLKINSEKELDLSLYKNMMHSYLFNVSYNHDITLTIVDFAEKRNSFRKGVKREGRLFPYKSYNQKLINYYYQGASTSIPFTKYLAFYHVAEFFFQSIAEQDAFQEIEKFITKPSFSPYEKEHIREFYSQIKKKIRSQREDGVWEEKTGLLLCIKKYIPELENLLTAIEIIDPSSVDYYKNTPVDFADGGSTINFDDDHDKVYVAIRDRVYSVRNAIVHSKDGEKLRYEPFNHDKELSKEIPLIRAISEEIIINSAESIKIPQ